MLNLFSRTLARSAGKNAMAWRSLLPTLRVGSRGWQQLRSMARIGLFAGLTGGICIGLHLNSKQIWNDAIVASQRRTGDVLVEEKKITHSKVTLNYQELAAGSVTGLFLGIVAGKLSSAIVFLTLAIYLLTQFLENKGIVTVPWKQMVNVGSERIDVKHLVFYRPSFKVSFVLSFLIAAFNV